MFHTLNAPHNGVNTHAICRGWLIYLSLLMLIPWTTTQAEQIGHTLTLSSAIKYSLEQNPSLRVFEFRKIALMGKKETANLRPAYEVGFEAENFSGSGNFSGLDSTELTVSLSSVIEMGDKRTARINVVGGSRALLDAERQVETLELLGEVTRRYVDVLAAQERVTLAEEAAQLAEETLSEVKKRSKAAAIPEAEVKRAQAATGQARLTVLSEKQQLSYLKVALAALWGEKAPSFLRIEGNLYQFAKDVEFQKLYSKIIQNPAIQVFAAEERLKEAEVRLTKTQASTDIRWSVGLRQFQETDDTAIMAGFSVPLFSSKRSTGSTTSAIAARDEVIIRKEAALLKLHTQLFRAYSNRQQAIVTLKNLQSSIIPSLEQALKETQKAYQRGRYSYLDYLTARQELISARRTLIEAGSAALRYGADIEQLTAEPLPVSQYDSLKKYPGLSQ